MSLRRAQFDMAHTNPTMNIWVSKQVLGQRDNPDDKPIKLFGKAVAGKSRLDNMLEALDKVESLTHKQVLEQTKLLSTLQVHDKLLEAEISERNNVLNKLDSSQRLQIMKWLEEADSSDNN